MILLYDGGERKAKKMVPIHIPAEQAKAARSQHRFHHGPGILAADLGADRLAPREGHGEVDALDKDPMRFAGNQVHFDPGRVAVVKGEMLKPLRVKIGPEMSIDNGEDIPIEGGGYPRGGVLRWLH